MEVLHWDVTINAESSMMDWFDIHYDILAEGKTVEDSDISSSESSYSLNFILDWFTDNPWTYLPASLVLAIVVILCFSTVAIVSQRKNHI